MATATFAKCRGGTGSWRRPAPAPGPLEHCITERKRSTMTDAQRYQLSQLQTLEAEAVFIIREVVAEFERPVLLFSGGKDSIVMLRLAEKAFCPARDPVPGDARGHRAQLPGGARLPGPPGRASWACSWSWPACRRRIDNGTVRRAAGRHPQPDPDPGAAGGAGEAPLHRDLRRRPAGRGQGPGEGADLLASATSSASGTRRTSGPSCGASTTAGSTRARASGSSRCPTGPSSTSGSTSSRRASSCRRSTSRTSARCSSATACSSGCTSPAGPRPARRSPCSGCATGRSATPA